MFVIRTFWNKKFLCLQINEFSPDLSKGGSTNSGRFSDNTGSLDSSFHQENSSNSPYEKVQYYSDAQRHSPASEPTYPQEYQTRKRLGRPPKKRKDKKLAPRSRVISLNNSTSTGISQVQINDNDLIEMFQNLIEGNQHFDESFFF